MRKKANHQDMVDEQATRERRLALKGLGCMIILGPQEVSQAIAIVPPRTQIAGALLRIIAIFRGLRIKVRARVTSHGGRRGLQRPPARLNVGRS